MACLLIGGVLWLATMNNPQAANKTSSRTLPQLAPDESQEDPLTSPRTRRACANDADSYLRTVASYEFKWNTDVPEDKFDRVILTSAGKDTVTLATTQLMLENGFGAYRRTILYCVYAIKLGIAFRYSLADPSLPEPPTTIYTPPEPSSTGEQTEGPMDDLPSPLDALDAAPAPDDPNENELNL